MCFEEISVEFPTRGAGNKEPFLENGFVTIPADHSTACKFTVGMASRCFSTGLSIEVGGA